MEHLRDRLRPITWVVEFTSLSRSSIQRRVKDGRFPAPIMLQGKRVAWWEGEVRKWALLGTERRDREREENE